MTTRTRRGSGRAVRGAAQGIAVVLCVLSLPGGARAEQKSGQLLVEPVVNGEAQKTGCTLRVYAGGAQKSEQEEEPKPILESPADAAIDLEAGAYDVATVCSTGKINLASLATDVRVRPGKTLTLPVKLESGSIVVHAETQGNRLQGNVALLFPGSGYEVASGLMGNRIEAAVGTYDVRVTANVDGENSVVTLEKQEVRTGRPQIIRIDMSPGMLQLTVLRNGKPAEGAGAITVPGRVRRLKEFTAGEPVPLAAGTYDVLGSLSSSFDFAEKRKRNVVITPGKVTEIKLDLARGTLASACSLDEKDAPATVFGFLPGAEDYFNSAPCGQALELSPGKYHFKVVLDGAKAGYRILGGAAAPDVWQRNVVIKSSKDTALKADFSPAHLLVRASRNGQPADAAVTVIPVAGGAALGGGPSGEDLPVPPGRYDVEVLWPSKSSVAKEMIRGITCQPRRTCTVDANLERAVLVLEVYKAGALQPGAEILLFKGGANVPYVKGRSGEALEVPPGEYVPEARLGDVKRAFSKMRLRAGDQETRKVELD